MWNEIRKEFRSLNINAIATNERLSRYTLSHDIDADIRSKKMKRWKDVRIQDFLSTSQLSIIISKTVNDTKSNIRSWKQQTIDSSNYVFSESLKKMFFQIFNADWLLSSSKNISRCENHDHNDFSNQCKIKTNKTRQNKQNTSKFLLTCWFQKISMFKKKRM